VTNPLEAVPPFREEGIRDFRKPSTAATQDLLLDNLIRILDMAKPEDMWQCQTVNCGYIFDPDRGDRKGKIPKGTLFTELPDGWKCPVCGAGKKMFRPLAGPASTAHLGAP